MNDNCPDTLDVLDSVMFSLDASNPTHINNESSLSNYEHLYSYPRDTKSMNFLHYT